MKILVDSFQSLSHVALDATGLTVLVGPSNRGKSALIRAIQGALFNLGGSYFVRKGSSSTQVTLDEVPTTHGGGLDLEWRKGKTTNEYTVNGEEYKKFGKGTPAPITDAGYKDVWIGDKDRKNGEFIRPQVHGQFDTMFLLARSPGFIADVLSTIQRRAVITRAQDRCSADLRNEKRVAEIRTHDLAMAEEQSAIFAPVPALTQRQSALSMATLKAATEHARLEGVTALVARRRDLWVLIPALRKQVAALKKVEAAAALAVTAAERQVQLAMVLARYQRLHAFAGMTLPPAVDPLAVSGLSDTLTRASAIVKALTGYRRLSVLAGQSLPESTVAPVMVSLDHWATRAQQLGDRWALVETSRGMVYELQRIVRVSAEEHDGLLAEYDTLCADYGVCPICERPFDDVPTPTIAS